MTENKKRNLSPKKLVPPKEVIEHLKKRKSSLPKNRLIKNIILFFGEGF